MEAAPASNRTKAKTGRKQRSPITGPSSHEAPFAALRSVEEEEQFAEQQAELLTQRRTTRKKEELEARTMATLAEGGSWELQPSSGYDAIVAKLTEEIAREKAELASEWGSLDMVVGQAFAENHMSAKDIVLRWDKKFKGAISRVEFRNEVWETLGVQASRKSLDALFDEFDLDHGGTLDSDELHQALVKVHLARSSNPRWLPTDRPSTLARTRSSTPPTITASRRSKTRRSSSRRRRRA